MIIPYSTVLFDTNFYLHTYGVIDKIHYFGKPNRILNLHHRLPIHKIILDWELVDLLDSNEYFNAYGLKI